MPAALGQLCEYVSSRPNLQIEEWTEQVGQGRISHEVASFVFDFFDAREVPIGQVRWDDRMQANLSLNEGLAQEWGDEFQEEFMNSFEVHKLFTPGPAPATIGELLSFVQQELDDWRADAKR